jgi:hypothetical protein
LMHTNRLFCSAVLCELLIFCDLVKTCAMDIVLEVYEFDQGRSRGGGRSRKALIHRCRIQKISENSIK